MHQNLSPKKQALGCYRSTEEKEIYIEKATSWTHDSADDMAVLWAINVGCKCIDSQWNIQAMA